MKNINSKYIFLIILLILIIGIIIYIFISNYSNNLISNYNTNNIDNNISDENDNVLNTDNTQINTNNNFTNSIDNSDNNSNKETEISTFSTEILDTSEGRLNNIKITCDILNNTIVDSGQIFSFNEIVGQPSSSRGYQEASIIINGEHETGIGGGNCQVSSTLYNAILEAENLSVIERNAHGGSGVAYVPEGKDAAVSYGSLDLKFRNDNNYKIKIIIASNNDTITATLYKIE